MPGTTKKTELEQIETEQIKTEKIETEQATSKKTGKKTVRKEKEISLEETFAHLEDAIAKLEDEDISLEASFQIYQEGMKLLKSCNEKIDKVEKEVLKLNESGELDEF